jgi:hypothetical protein
VELRPELVSLTFERSSRALPLQAADLFAWEFYQDELYFLKNDAPREGEFHRKLLERMAKSGRFRIQSGDKNSVSMNIEVATKHLHAAGTMDDLDKYFGKP